jgi:hypothetical protein
LTGSLRSSTQKIEWIDQILVAGGASGSTTMAANFAAGFCVLWLFL